MSRPIIRIHNVETDEIIDREMTVAEFKIAEAKQAIQAKAEIEAQTKEAAKAVILDRLGLTIEELQVLLG